MVPKWHIEFLPFYPHIESCQEVNPAKKDPVSVSMIVKKRTFLSGIITNQAIVQTHGPKLRFILKSLLVVIFCASSDQPNSGWHADQTSDTLRNSSVGEGQFKDFSYYRTRVRSLAMLVTHWLTDWLPFSKLDWCDPGMWRWQLKTCWGFYCCWCWWWGSC